MLRLLQLWGTQLGLLWLRSSSAVPLLPPDSIPLAQPPTSKCPARAWQAVQQTGMLPVTLAGGQPDAFPFDNAPAIRTALAWQQYCGGSVFVPPGSYYVNSTINLCPSFGCGHMAPKDPLTGQIGSCGMGHQLQMIGSSVPPSWDNTSSEYGMQGKVAPYGRGGQAVLYGSQHAHPLIHIGNESLSCGGNVILENLSVEGYELGLRVQNYQMSSLRNVAISARVYTGGMDNAAMVLEDSYWMWMDNCAFTNALPPNIVPYINSSTRPSVIMRGIRPQGSLPIAEDYLIRFYRTIFSNGGVRYEQQTTKNATVGGPALGTSTGWFVFESVTQEASATPLLDIWCNPSIAKSGKFEEISVRDYMDADAPNREYYWGAPVIRFNCSTDDAVLDGVTIAQAGDSPSAVEVVAGKLGGVFVVDGHGTAGNAAAVVRSDSGGDPTKYRAEGNAVIQSSGGLTIIGTSDWSESRSQGSTGSELTGGNTHAISVGASGDLHARWTLSPDGSTSYGRGGEAPLDTTLRFHAYRSVAWDPPRLAPGGVTSMVSIIYRLYRDRNPLRAALSSCVCTEPV
jgi:hypothetical protein